MEESQIPIGKQGSALTQAPLGNCIVSQILSFRFIPGVTSLLHVKCVFDAGAAAGAARKPASGRKGSY